MLDEYRKEIDISIIVVLLIFGVFTRFYNLSNSDIGMDEGATYFFSRMSFLEILQSGEPNSPIFYLLEGWIVDIFGHTNVAIKFLPAICSALTVPMTYMVCRKITDSRTMSILVSSLVLMCPILIHYGQEARGYAVASFFIIWAFYYYLEIIDGKDDVKTWVKFSIVSVIGICMHYMTLLPLAIMLVYVFWVKRKEIKSFSSMKNIYISIGIMIVILIPIMYSVINAVYVTLRPSPLWESGTELLDTILMYFSFNTEWIMYAFIMLLIAGIVLLLLKDKRFGPITVAMVIVPLVFVILLSLITHGVTRYVLFIAPFFYLLIAYPLILLKDKTTIQMAISIVCIIIIASMSIPILENQYENNARCDWKDVTDILTENTEEGDCIVYSPKGMEWGLYGGLSFYHDYEKDGVDVKCADNMDELDAILNDGRYNKIFVLTWENMNNEVVKWAYSLENTTLLLQSNGLSLFIYNGLSLVYTSNSTNTCDINLVGT